MKTSQKLRSVSASLLLASAALVGVGSGTDAFALPPEGAATVDTAGTSSRVSPTTLAAGDTISFTVSGFPAGEQLYVKVDDGDACPSDSAQGACVVHQQKISSNGTVSGSFVLSKELSEGTHTLRFLATEIVTDSKGNYQGSKGYTNRSPEFTISGVNENSSGGSVVNVDPNVINSIEENTSSNNSGSSSNQGSGSSGDGASTTNQNSSSSGREAASTRTGSDGQTIYLDADGNPISKEEYEALLAESQDEGQEESAAAENTASASASASATASSSASQEAEALDSQEASNSSSSSTPWVGIIALGLALVIAGVVLYKRRRAAQ